VREKFEVANDERIIAHVLEHVAGCKDETINDIHMNRASLILLVFFAGCKTIANKDGEHSKNAAPPNTFSSDQAEARIAAYEHMIKNVLPSPFAVDIYVPLDDEQLQALKTQMAQFKIKKLSPDLQSIARKKYIVTVHHLKIDGPVAKVEASWSFSGTYMIYAFDLLKVSRWSVTNAVVKRGAIAD
jgi:hypothetical protein